MPFILIAIARCLEICLTLFVTELILPVAYYIVASGKPESNRLTFGIETIKLKFFSRFRTNSMAEAKITAQARCGLRCRHYARQADRGGFTRAYHGELRKQHWYLRFLPVVNAAFTTGLCGIYQL